MIYKISDNIISSLGFSSEEVYQKVKSGISLGKLHAGVFSGVEPFYSSLLNWEAVNQESAKLFSDGMKYTPFEKIAILSASKAIESAKIDPSSSSVLFVLSTTKGNIGLLEENDGYEKERIHLWRSAQLIGKFFQNPNEVLVVSNACISGVSAQLLAIESMQLKGYDYAVVVGADVLSKFVISGFQSFKALSNERCKPFDAERRGLNLGEAAATIVFHRGEPSQGDVVFRGGGNRNDANHISGPSRTGEGLYNAIQNAVKEVDLSKLAFINAHGTATPYNDDMESWAIERSGLSNVPVNSLKGYFGHTLGAAGILECIISAHAVADNTLLGTMGYETFGVAKNITINKETKTCCNPMFLKIISGFGGSNAAICFEKLG